MRKNENMIENINKIASDKKLDRIEKRVKIAEFLSGHYSQGPDKILVYRSPANRTLLAIEGNLQGQFYHIIDLVPDKILFLIQKYNLLKE